MTRIPLKACPFVLRNAPLGIEVLAFRHPTAGHQWVKGTVAPNETPHAAARRELTEESGLIAPARLQPFGTLDLSNPCARWHLYACAGTGLPDAWSHQTHDDHGHRFAFFWHPADQPLDDKWHAQFRQPFDALKDALEIGLWQDAQNRLARLPA